jgi:hypothetical protein
MPKESLLSTAYQFIRHGDHRTAERLLTGLIRKEPRNQYAWLLLAACKPGREEQEKCLEFVVEINPDNRPALQALGELLAGRDCDEIILRAFEDWLVAGVVPDAAQIDEQSESLEETPAAPVGQPESIVLEPVLAAADAGVTRKSRPLRTLWLWLAIVLLAIGQAVSLARIAALQQALVTSQVRLGSLEAIITELMVRVEVLELLVR